MNTEYFFFALTPTKSGLAFIYTKSFTIDYDDASDLANQQTDYENQFRAFNGNPAHYNAQWSIGYANKTTADTDRTSEITALQNAGNTVETPDFP
jgi:hypothetical protein